MNHLQYDDILLTTEVTSLNICPCCGSQITCNLRLEACATCGAFAVGPPLARPEHELPSYMRSLAIIGGAAMLALTFISSTIAALFERQPLSFKFWNIIASAETAAWRLQWLALPLALVTVWAARRVSATIKREPTRFMGLRLARAGFAVSTFVAASIVVLVAVTIPERLHQRELAAQAARNAIGYEAGRVLLEYQTQHHGMLPASPDDLKKLPDPDGSVARVIALIKEGAYEPESAIASLPTANSKSRTRRGGTALRTRPISLRSSSDDMPDEGLSFTNYKLALPGKDQKLGTDDDILLRDGVIISKSPASKQSSQTTSTNRLNAP